MQLYSTFIILLVQLLINIIYNYMNLLLGSYYNLHIIDTGIQQEYLCKLQLFNFDNYKFKLCLFNSLCKHK